MTTERETHIGKAGTAHGLEHCRPSWCGDFPGEGHPLAATEDEKRLLAEGKDPYLVYIGAYAPRPDPNARIGAYADATGIDLPDGTDTFQHLQKPDLHPAGDPLAAFVKARIIDLELEPRHEFPRVYGLEAGPIAHRYAKHVRADCVAFRVVVAEYLDEVERVRANREEAGVSARAYGIRAAVRALAERWDDHPDFDERWRLT